MILLFCIFFFLLKPNLPHHAMPWTFLLLAPQCSRGLSYSSSSSSGVAPPPPPIPTVGLSTPMWFQSNEIMVQARRTHPVMGLITEELRLLLLLLHAG